MMEAGATLAVADLGVVDYGAALSLQTAMVSARLEGRIGDTLLLMEHPHVFTLGRGADERFIVANPASVPIHRVSRGGQVTYHGPGQLIGYPILKLEGRARDVTLYLRNLEQAMIDALNSDTDTCRPTPMFSLIEVMRHPSIPHGTIESKKLRSVDTLSAKP